MACWLADSLQVERDGLFKLPGLFVVRGELRGHPTQIRRVAQFQRLRHAAVQQTAAGRARVHSSGVSATPSATCARVRSLAPTALPLRRLLTPASETGSVPRPSMLTPVAVLTPVAALIPVAAPAFSLGRCLNSLLQLWRIPTFD